MKTSVVIVSRNDGYGGNLRERALFCLTCMIETFDEVIYVDYNSPERSLIDEIRSELIEIKKLKHIIVTPEQHMRFVKGDLEAENCCEVLARNIGIRRATGDIIVSSNIDILPMNKKMLTFFLENFYQPNLFYTFMRRNINFEFPKDYTYTYDEILSFRDKAIKNTQLMKVKGFEPYWAIISGCGDFQLTSKEIWNDIKGFEESYIYRSVADVHVQMKSVVCNHSVVAMIDFPVFHINHGTDNDEAKKNPQYGTKLRREKTNNGDNWGFINEKFMEEII